MTREEAIAVIQEVFDNAELSHCGHYATALDMAIEALSQPIVAKHFDIQNGYIYCSPQIAENVKVVVRCRDCKQRRVEGDCTNYYYCDFLGSICGDNEYCSFGERREP